MYRYLALIPVVVILAGCEKTVSDPEWPEYNELLVVRGSITFTANDSLITECIVRRTLPLWEEYTLSNAVVPTASVTLNHNDDEYQVPLVTPSSARYIHSLHYQGFGQYSLTVSNASKIAHAHIRVENLSSEFDSIIVVPHTNSYEIAGLISYVPERKESFVVRLRYRTHSYPTWTYLSSIPYVPGRSYNFNYGFDEVAPNVLLFSDIAIYSQTNEDITVEMSLDTYSREYTAYELSNYSYYGGDEFFGDSDENPPFNITGDGIGFFWYKIEGPWKRITIEQ